jgi:hypothetical protein
VGPVEPARVVHLPHSRRVAGGATVPVHRPPALLAATSGRPRANCREWPLSEPNPGPRRDLALEFRQMSSNSERFARRGEDGVGDGLSDPKTVVGRNPTGAPRAGSSGSSRQALSARRSRREPTGVRKREHDALVEQRQPYEVVLAAPRRRNPDGSDPLIIWRVRVMPVVRDS